MDQTQAPSAEDASAVDTDPWPLDGIRVVEFCHMVMGPTCGMILADLGADVIKVEPPGGDTTRKLVHQGAGFFASYNRNTRSIGLDIKSPQGLAAAKRLALGADVVIENLRPGALAATGLGYETLSKENPGLVYCALKGFLDGPYAHRKALDDRARGPALARRRVGHRHHGRHVRRHRHPRGAA